MTRVSPTRIDSDEIYHRFGYHPGTSVTIPAHERVREAYIAFGEFLASALPDGRAKSTAFTKLQESSMWANYGIAELAPVVNPFKGNAKLHAAIANYDEVRETATEKIHTNLAETEA